MLGTKVWVDWFGTFGPLVVSLLVSLIALGGVIWSNDRTRRDGDRTWWRNTRAEAAAMAIAHSRHTLGTLNDLVQRAQDGSLDAVTAREGVKKYNEQQENAMTEFARLEGLGSQDVARLGYDYGEKAQRAILYVTAAVPPQGHVNLSGDAKMRTLVGATETAYKAFVAEVRESLGSDRN